jgi:hypothetical protein
MTDALAPERAIRRAELARMRKSDLIRMCRAGVATPGGGVCYIEGGMYPLDQWQKDEIVASILNAEYPPEV